MHNIATTNYTKAKSVFIEYSNLAIYAATALSSTPMRSS
jgi:hypothetical protein